MSTMRRSTAVLSLLVSAACSSDSSAAQSWAGSWARTGTQVESCNGSSTSTALGGTVSIALETSGASFTMSPTCGLEWSVGGASNDSATLAPGAPCAVALHGSSVSVTFTQGSATLNDSTIMASIHGSETNGCTVTQKATLTRLAVPPQGSR